MIDPLFLAWQMTALASCVIAGIAMVYFFIKFSHTRTHPGPVLLSIFLSTCIANIMRVGLQTWVSAANSSETHRIAVTFTDVANKELGATTDLDHLDQYVPFFFWCAFFFITSATMWYLMLALDLIFSLSNPFLPFNADNLKHHIFAWPASLLYCIGFRYVLDITDQKRIHHVALYLHLPEYLVLIYITGALGIAWRRSRRLELHTHQTTRRMAKLILPYLAVFAIYALDCFIMYILSLQSGHETPVTNAIDQLAEVLECLSIFVLFCRDARVLTAMSRPTGEQLLSHDQRTLSQIEMNDFMANDPHEKLDISNKLRMDVMKYTSMGIQQSIKQNMGTNSQVLDGSNPEIGLEDYNRIESMSIVVHGTRDSGVLSFRDCAPKVFQHIRHHFRIDPRFFLESFDEDKILSEHGSEGRSGNLFYFTANKQFMVKSVPKTEYDTLRSILPQYHRYLLSNPQSLLCRYFGCYSISLPVGKRRMYFVVMQNLFNEGPVQHRFDLKGNTDRRQAIAATDVEKYIQDAREKRNIDQLMMDIDFRKLCGGMKLTPGVAESVQGQLCDDIVFLASRGIIDYSILLGVRFVPSGERTGTGIGSSDSEVIYYLGMIDMLQRYNWRWTIQRWVLGLLCKDTDDVSAVPPELYASRLEEFVRSRLFHINGPNETRLHSHAPSRGGYDTGKRRTTTSQVHHPQHRVLTINPSHGQFNSTPMFLSEAQISPSSISASSEALRPSSSSVAYSSVCQSPLSRPSSTNYSIQDQRYSSASNSSTINGGVAPIAPMGSVPEPKKPGYFI